MTNNKLRKEISLIISMLIICAVSGCKKTVVPPTYDFSKDGLTYIQFNAGKYFIYKDSVTAQTDSVVVTESTLLSFQSSSLGYLYNGQSYNLVLSKIVVGKDSVWLNGIATAALSSNIYLSGADGYVFRYPPCNCGSASLIPSLVESSIPSMVVEGKTYANVVLTKIFLRRMCNQRITGQKALA